MPVDLVVEGVPWQGEELVDDAERLLQALSLQQTELSLLVCDDDVMRRLNRDYRGQDRPTDVLAFAMREAKAPIPTTSCWATWSSACPRHSGRPGNAVTVCSESCACCWCTACCTCWDTITRTTPRRPPWSPKPPACSR